MSNNYFSTPLKPYDSASGYWPINGLFEAFFRHEFDTAEMEVLTAFLQSGLDQMDRNGLVSLLPKEEGCDGDVRIDLVYTPSYAVAAIGVCLLVNHPQTINGLLEQKLQTLMNRAFENGIAGHGYGADRYRREVLCMFALTGAKSFLEQQPDFCPEMAAALNKQLELVRMRPEGDFDWTNPKDLTNLSIKTLAAWEGNTEPVFVYGTLMQGQSAHGYMDGSTFAGQAVLSGYAIYRVNWYPGIVPKEGKTVSGELYYVSKQMLPKMDEYEGVGVLYERKTVSVETKHGKTEAYIYEYLLPVSGDPMKGGRWV